MGRGRGNPWKGNCDLVLSNSDGNGILAVREPRNTARSHCTIKPHMRLGGKPQEGSCLCSGEKQQRPGQKAGLI